MTISELQKALAKAKRKYGDIQVNAGYPFLIINNEKHRFSTIGKITDQDNVELKSVDKVNMCLDDAIAQCQSWIKHTEGAYRVNLFVDSDCNVWHLCAVITETEINFV